MVQRLSSGHTILRVFAEIDLRRLGVHCPRASCPGLFETLARAISSD